MSKIPKYKTFLYASDLGSHTRPVFRHAAGLARQYQARIVMLHVVEPIGLTGEAVLNTYLPRLNTDKFEREGLQKILEQMKKRLRKFCREELDACDGESTLVSKIVVAQGHPSEQIIRMAKKHKADMIILGSCTHTVLGRPTMGSTARHVVLHASAPVLVVPNVGK